MGEWSRRQTDRQGTDPVPFVDSTKEFGFGSKSIEHSFLSKAVA